MRRVSHYESPETGIGLKPNRWDVLALILILGILVTLAWAANQMQTPYQIGKPLDISLNPSALPGYAANTVLRMFIALLCSLTVTLIVAPIAAKSRQAEKFLIPVIDILQSVPILGMLSITIVLFIQLFPGSLLGPECAAIFAIFTSQVWNMLLSFYQSLKTIPKELRETSAIFHLSGWQRFWRIEVPFGMPSLIWNMMVSMSAGWFFVVAAEAIAVSNQQILLPGIGSYIRVAITNGDLPAMYYAIFAMLIVILLYDQLLFRPLLTWTERFKMTRTYGTPPPKAWVYQLLTKTHWLKFVRVFFKEISEFLLNSRRMRFPVLNKTISNLRYARWLVYSWNVLLTITIVSASAFLINFITQNISFSEIKHVFYLGLITGFKVAILIILASLVWVPIGIWVGLRPKATQIMQPIIQFLAAFPVNLIYPVIVTLIVHYNLNVQIWSTPLMILGTQWYILFNIIAGTAAIPTDLLLATQNLGVKKWLWWKRLALPATFPYYVTGSITAAAGCWNASIVADVLQWGPYKLVAIGLGSYIAQYTEVGDFPRIALGIAVMSFYVLIINHLVWRKLYQFSSTRFIME